MGTPPTLLQPNPKKSGNQFETFRSSFTKSMVCQSPTCFKQFWTDFIIGSHLVYYLSYYLENLYTVLLSCVVLRRMTLRFLNSSFIWEFLNWFARYIFCFTFFILLCV